MTNQEMYQKFVEKNNHMKTAMTYAGNKHLIGHIESIDLAKNKVISTMQGKRIEGYITQLVMAVMNGQFVVSNPSALQGFNFSLLNAKPVIKKEDKQEMPKKETSVQKNELILSKEEKEQQKELASFYASVKAETTNEDYELFKYYKGEVGYIVPLENGDSFVIKKPSIKTRFCYGYGQYANSTQEDEDRANACVKNANTNVQHFIDENMDTIRNAIALYTDTNKEFYKYDYEGTPEDERHFKNIVDISKADDIMLWKERQAEYHPYLRKMCNIQQLSDREIQNIIRGYKVVGAKMEQRLSTYLKKYGLSKVEAWSYLRD